MTKQRNTIPFKPKPLSVKSRIRQHSAEDALAGMRLLPDNKDKAVYKLVFRGGKVYALIPHTAKKEGTANAETTVPNERG